MAQHLSEAGGELAAMAVADFSADGVLTLLCRVASQSLDADGVVVRKVAAGRSDHLMRDGERSGAVLLARVAVSYLVLAADRAEFREVQQQLTHR